MTTILIKKKDTAGAPAAGDLTNAAGGAEIAVNTATKRIYTKDSGGNVVEVGTNPSALTTNLLFSPDATYDIGASGASRPRDMFLSRNLTVGGTLTLAGGVNLNGNVTVGDASTDTLTINSTITSNLIFTDNTYDIGASGATRPRSIFLAGSATVGSLTSGRVTFSGTSGLLSDSANLTWDGTTLATGGKFGITGNGAAPTATALQIGTNGVGSRWVYNTPTGGEHDFSINGVNSAYVAAASVGGFTSGGSVAWSLSNATAGALTLDSSANLLVKTSTARANITTDANLVSQNGLGILATSTTYGQGSQYIRFFNSSAAYAGSISQTASTAIGLYSAGDLTFGANSTAGATLTSAGNFLVGTQTLTYGKLVVLGATSTPSLTVGTTATAVIAGGSGQELAITESGTAPYGIGLQARNSTGGPSGTSYPILLNPLGGGVVIGANSGAGVLTLAGSGALQQYFISTTATSVDNQIISLCNNGSTYSVQSFDAAQYKFLTSGTERVRISTDGVLQVGRTGGTAPDGKLQVIASGTGAGAANTKLGFALIEDDSGNGAGLWLGSMTNENTGVIGSRTATGNIAFQTYNGGWGERMRLTYQGNLLVGTTSTSGYASTTAPKLLVVAGSDITATTIQTMPCMTVVNSTNGNASGYGVAFKFAFSTAEPGKYSAIAGVADTIFANATALAFYTNPNGTAGADNTTQRMYIASNGSIGAPSGTNIYNASDLRVKQNINDLSSGLNAILSLRAVSFNWKENFCKEENDKILYGFIAQEVQSVDENLVESFGQNKVYYGDPENIVEVENPLRVNEKFVIPMLVKAIQELNAKVTALENK
jgi:Chaperone of endosialidase